MTTYIQQIFTDVLCMIVEANYCFYIIDTILLINSWKVYQRDFLNIHQTILHLFIYTYVPLHQQRKVNICEHLWWLHRFVRSCLRPIFLTVPNKEFICIERTTMYVIQPTDCPGTNFFHTCIHRQSEVDHCGWNSLLLLYLLIQFGEYHIDVKHCSQWCYKDSC